MGSLFVEKIDNPLVDYLHIDQNYNLGYSCYSYCFDSYYTYDFYDVYFHRVRSLVVHGAVEHILLVGCNFVDCCNLADCNLVADVESLVEIVEHIAVEHIVVEHIVVEHIVVEHIVVEHIVVVGILDSLNYHIVDKHLGLVDRLFVGYKNFFDFDKFVVVDSNNFGHNIMVQVQVQLRLCKYYFDSYNVEFYSLLFDKLSLTFKIFIYLLLQVC
jgi:hypothetical protein